MQARRRLRIANKRKTQLAFFEDGANRQKGGYELTRETKRKADGQNRTRLAIDNCSHKRVEVRVGQCVVAADMKKDVPLPHTAYDRAESRIGTVDVPVSGEFEIVVATISAGADAQYYDLSAVRLSEKPLSR